MVNLDLGRILTTYRLADHCMPMSGYDRVLVDAGLFQAKVGKELAAFFRRQLGDLLFGDRVDAGRSVGSGIGSARHGGEQDQRDEAFHVGHRKGR